MDIVYIDMEYKRGVTQPKCGTERIHDSDSDSDGGGGGAPVPRCAKRAKVDGSSSSDNESDNEGTVADYETKIRGSKLQSPYKGRNVNADIVKRRCPFCPRERTFGSKGALRDHSKLVWGYVASDPPEPFR